MFFYLEASFQHRAWSGVHPLQVIALCPMMTKRVSNEEVLLAHTGTAVRVIPREAGHWLLAQKWSGAGSYGQRPSGVRNQFLDTAQTSGMATQASHWVTAVRAQPSSCSTEHMCFLTAQVSISSSHTLHPQISPSSKHSCSRAQIWGLHLTADCYTASATGRYHRPGGSSQPMVKIELFV